MKEGQLNKCRFFSTGGIDSTSYIMQLDIIEINY